MLHRLIRSIVSFFLVGLLIFETSRISSSNKIFESDLGISNPIDYPELIKQSASVAIFHTDAFLPKKDNSIISFPYKFDKSRDEMWLSLKKLENEKSLIILVDHPVFDELTGWTKVENSSYTLYQKVYSFKSVENFISNWPKDRTIISDPHLISDEMILLGPNVFPIHQWQEVEFEFLLTTYHEPVAQSGYKLFSAKVDISNAVESDCEDLAECKKQITWKLDIPNANESNNWYIGMIHLNQRQW